MAIKKMDSRMVQIPASIEQLNTVSLSANSANLDSVVTLKSLTVFGTISALSGYNIIVSNTTQTSALSVSNIAPFPALQVSQGFASPVVATFSYNNTNVATINSNGIETPSVNSPSITSTYIRTDNLQFNPGGGVVNDAVVFGNLTVYGSVTALSGILNIQTAASTTSSLSVYGTGVGPAIGITQIGTGNLAEFTGGNNVNVLTIKNSLGNFGPYVTVSGPVSALGTIYDSKTNSNDWGYAYNSATQYASLSSRYNSVYTTTNTNSARYESAYTTTNTNSSNWQSVYTTVQNNSSDAWSLKYTLVNSSTFNALANNSYLVNTANSTITATLPSVPLTGDTIQFNDPFSTWGTNIFTISRNNNNIEGTTENLYCNTADSRFTLTFVGSARGWKVSQ
jgi:hypothetical protein